MLAIHSPYVEAELGRGRAWADAGAVCSAGWGAACADAARASRHLVGPEDLGAWRGRESLGLGRVERGGAA